MFEQTLLRNYKKAIPPTLHNYLESGGYEGLRRVLNNFDHSEVIQIVKDANLRGRGGAGFPTGLKWSFIPQDSDEPKYLCCNADEGEPGTFKDRVLMESDPHQLLEGIAIASYAIRANKAYIYIRNEFALAIERLTQAINESVANGFLGNNILESGFKLDIYLHKGAGSYICGEETALLNSLEGYRGVPRLKPPFPAIKGYCACPTVINNVETLCCVPHIVTRGANWFKNIGPEKCPGPKLFCLSGHVKYPDVYELPMGIPLRQLIEEFGGGTPSGKKIKAVIPGGASAPMFPENKLDIAMDFDSLSAAGSMLGSAGVIVMDENTSIVSVVKRMLEFFNHESCGKCTPCREGTSWIVKIFRRLEAGKGTLKDIELLQRLCDDIFGNSFCALGDGAMMALRGGLEHFHGEFLDCVG